MNAGAARCTMRLHDQLMPPRVRLPADLRTVPFSVSQGRDAGLSRKRMRGRDLQVPFRGARRSETPETVEAAARSYLPVMDEEAFFCSITAAALLGMPLPRTVRPVDAVHVGVPWPHRAPRGAGVVGHKFVITPQEIAELRGLTLTSPARTWCDLAGVLPLPDLVAAGDWVLRSGTDPVELAALAGRHPGRRGRAQRLRAFSLLDARSESPKESNLRTLVVTAGLTHFVPNVEVIACGHRYRLDLAWTKKRIALEYQGGYHNDERQWRRDMTRRARLEAEGWTVIFINSDDLRDPAELVRRIRMLANHA